MEPFLWRDDQPILPRHDVIGNDTEAERHQGCNWSWGDHGEEDFLLHIDPAEKEFQGQDEWTDATQVPV